jgi:hypothetical protein
MRRVKEAMQDGMFPTTVLGVLSSLVLVAVGEILQHDGDLNNSCINSNNVYSSSLLPVKVYRSLWFFFINLHTPVKVREFPTLTRQGCKCPVSTYPTLALSSYTCTLLLLAEDDNHHIIL